MPLYEYECDSCRHRFEVIQKFSDPAIEVCPSCGNTVHKLLSLPAIQFKGTGWYITDYAQKGRPAESTGDSSTERTKDEKSSPSSSSSSSDPADKVPAGSSPKDS